MPFSRAITRRETSRIWNHIAEFVSNDGSCYVILFVSYDGSCYVILFVSYDGSCYVILFVSYNGSCYVILFVSYDGSCYVILCTTFYNFLYWKLITRVRFEDMEDIKKKYDGAVLHYIRMKFHRCRKITVSVTVEPLSSTESDVNSKISSTENDVNIHSAKLLTPTDMLSII